MKRERAKLWLAAASFVVAAFIAIAALFLPPRGVIDSSALWAIAQFLIMCCTVLGIDVELEKFLHRLKNENH
jgi:hypothetical protein